MNNSYSYKSKMRILTKSENDLSTYKIAVLIPCYNEAKTIQKVIQDFQLHLPSSEIWVCDNNSTDETASIAKSCGAKVLKEYKQGKGHAVLNLFRKVSADVFIMVDGDDTYPAKQAAEMIDALVAYDLDMIVGDRLSNGTYEEENKRAFHHFGNHLIKKLINSFFHSNLHDILSGYRVFSKRFITNYATLAKGFELETDLSIFALHYNIEILELPIHYKDRPPNSFSKLNTYKDGFKILLTFFNLYRLYRPLSFFTLLSFMVMSLSFLFGSFPIYEFIKFNYVYKVPTAILAGFLAISALLFFICGLILDSLTKMEKKSMQLAIRNTRAK